MLSDGRPAFAGRPESCKHTSAGRIPLISCPLSARIPPARRESAGLILPERITARSGAERIRGLADTILSSEDGRACCLADERILSAVQLAQAFGELNGGCAVTVRNFDLERATENKAALGKFPENIPGDGGFSPGDPGNNDHHSGQYAQPDTGSFSKYPDVGSGKNCRYRNFHVLLLPNIKPPFRRRGVFHFCLVLRRALLH